MSDQKYKNQVRILLKVLPFIAKEECFALHGGTAINLFVRNMPRLSVDIDLTYLPIEDRDTTLSNIDLALTRIHNLIKKHIPQTHITYKNKMGKLIIRMDYEEIKIEVNLVNRGTITPAIKMTLCEEAQKMYDVFVAMNTMPVGQLYGGKICAALDRQHPRDLFDVKLLMENEGFSDSVREGFIPKFFQNAIFWLANFALLAPLSLSNNRRYCTPSKDFTGKKFTLP